MADPVDDVAPPARPPSESVSSSRPFWAVVLLGLAVLAVAGPYKMITGHEGGNYSNGKTVHMVGLRFSPNRVVVAPGTVVWFVNDDVAPHTVTARDRSIDSGVLKPGTGTFKLTVGGRLEYVCTIHSSMTGTIEISG